MVKAAFTAQRKFLTIVSKCKQPTQQMLESLLKPTSDQISAIQVVMIIITFLSDWWTESGNIPDVSPAKQPFWDRPGVLEDKALEEASVHQGLFLTASSQHRWLLFAALETLKESHWSAVIFRNFWTLRCANGKHLIKSFIAVSVKVLTVTNDSSTLTHSRLDAGNISFLWFVLLSMCQLLHVAVKKRINLFSVHLL